MIARVQKWGNSLGLRIPKAFAAEARLAPGAPVDVTVREGKLVVRPLATRRPRRLSLDRLLARVAPENLHGPEWPDGTAGRELPL